jgi:putative aldouronate transport system permease protein
MSIPVIATVGLFTGLAYWNDWINALYYISSPKYYGIQNLLIRLMNNIQFLKSSQASTLLAGREMELPSTGIRMALAVLGILPILILYPFLQKYLIKGVVMGAVKG